MLELRVEMTKKVYDWWLAHVHEYFMNRQSNAESKAIKEAHAQGVEFKKVIMTSLPVGRDHDDRPDQPFYQPRRSRATIEWKRGLGKLKQELAEEHGLTEFEGLIPQEEILPRVDWVVPDDLLANMLHTQVLDSEPYYGLSLQEWQQNRDAGTATSKCFHPIPVVEPYRGLTSLVRTLLEVSAPVSEFSIVPSRKDRPTDFGNQYTGRFNYNLEEGISAGIFLTNGPDMTNLELLAPQLKVLRLSLHSTWTQGHALLHSYHGLARMLGKAECLEELDLHFSGHQYYSECDLIHRLKLDKLRRARFSDLGFSDRDFCKFVQTHRHTLVELVVFNCGLKDEWRTSEDDAWWWPTLDILRQLRFLDGMSLYINKVGQPDPDVQILEMEGDPTREIGAARWENWVAGRGTFSVRD
ncbi:hypothetical protein GTA08_BOTSDO10136 [Botryosphaeria dothidea]|uniref:Uncharacterized protein n=1 Tax=Botryosphaeria dothidea TaxID=55169 RepID=A0A8H4IIY2_9PEZI|nr:hypothetical protein GTA08_BOTSDO10136 [Botryosphaeria dothidea]